MKNLKIEKAEGAKEVCQSCSDRQGIIKWRGKLWCGNCFESEAKIRLSNKDWDVEKWIRRVLGVVDQGEYGEYVEAEDIDSEYSYRGSVQWREV